MFPYATSIHHDISPHHGGFLLHKGGSDIPIPRSPAHGSIAITSSEELHAQLAWHATFAIGLPTPGFAEEQEEAAEEAAEEGGGEKRHSADVAMLSGRGNMTSSRPMAR